MTNNNETDQQEIPEPSFNFNTTTGDIRKLANQLNQAEGFDTEGTGPDTLADYVSALKMLENAVEEARKNVFEPALDAHVEPGDRVGNLERQTRTRRYVEDDAKAFDTILDNDLDPREYAKVNVGDLEDALGAKAGELLGEREFTFYKRLG